mgnify:FL=1
MNTLTRFDKNLGHNVKDFSDYGEDATLVLCLAIFLAHEYQNNLFNTYRLDVDKFAKKMGFDKDSLKAIHPNPEHQKLYNPETDIRLFSNKIENALYKMQTIPIIFKKKASTIKDGVYTEISGMLIFKSVRFFADSNRKGQAKHYYDIELSNEFEKHLNLFYFHIDLNENKIKQLRKNNLFFLYLHLKNNENYLTSLKRTDQSNNIIKSTYKTHFVFDEMCELIGLTRENTQSYTATKKKYILKNKIKKLNEIANTNYTIDFVKAIQIIMLTHLK